MRQYYTTDYLSPIGRMKLASDGESLLGLWIEGQKYFGDSVEGEMTENSQLAIFKQVNVWLDRYFAGEKPDVSELSLAPQGGEFRQAVWKILCEIPYGQVVTYGDIAREMAVRMNRKTMSAQAVGGAVGHNPISVIIPCHRVVGTSGSLTGYAGGIEKKIWLLAHEGLDMEKFAVPKKGTAL